MECNNRVLFILNANTHYYRGFLEQFENHSNYEIHLITPDERSCTLGSGVYEELSEDGLKHYRLPEKKYFGIFLGFLNLEDCIKKIDPVAVITIENYIDYFFINSKLRRLFKKKRIAIILKSIPFQLENYNERFKSVGNIFTSKLVPEQSKFKKKLDQFKILYVLRILKILWDKRIYSRVDAHINYIDGHKIWKTYGVDLNKVFVTGNTPDTSKFIEYYEKLEAQNIYKNEKPFVFIHVGRLVKWKKVDLLIEAFGQLVSEGYDVRLNIIGSGEESDNLLDLITKKRLHKKVNFMGPIHSIEDLGLQLFSAHAYVLAGMGGISINDAMCFAKPIICSRCDGTEKDLVFEGYNGLFFEEDKARDLYKKMKTMVLDFEGTKRMGYNSLEIIKSKVNETSVSRRYIKAIDYAVDKKNE